MSQSELPVFSLSRVDNFFVLSENGFGFVEFNSNVLFGNVRPDDVLLEVNIAWFGDSLFSESFLNDWLSGNGLCFENLVFSLDNFHLEVFSFENGLNDGLVDEF